MIIWLASYPKSGNTYIRSFLSAYYYSDDGQFNFDLLKNIKKFPDKNFFDKKIENIDEASVNWEGAQKAIKEKRQISFLKTHNCLGSFKGIPFTTANYTLGAIYIVRDPRNIVTSLKNHFSLNDDEAINFIKDEKRATQSEATDFSTYSFISSWSNHYKSWLYNKNFRKMLIRYEDLENNKYETFRDIIVFVNTLMNKTERVNKSKLETAIKSTNFNVLKNLEKNTGFDEATYSKKDKKNITFFNLGFNNRWKKILSEDTRENIEKCFYKEMKELEYLS